MKSIQSLEKGNETDDLHYSTCVSLSKTDFQSIKADLIQAIESAREKIRISAPEDLYCFAVDFFDLTEPL